MAYGSVKMCLQCATCSMVSTCLFRALKFLSYRDSRVQKEACQWPKGKTLRLEIPGARGFTVTVRSLKVSAGAGFIVAYTGDIMTMPGLPRVPAAENIDVDENGVITGLF